MSATQQQRLHLVSFVLWPVFGFGVLLPELVAATPVQPPNEAQALGEVELNLPPADQVATHSATEDDQAADTDSQSAGASSQPPDSPVRQPPRTRPQTTVPPPTRTPVVPDRLPTLASRTARNPMFYRLASVPEMFGDFFGGGTITATVGALGPPGTATATLPTAGGARRFKAAENNKPFPQDRVFFMYNHFHNAIETELTGSLLGAGPTPDDFSVDRYTFGLEKTFCEGMWSAEVRMPFAGRFAEETAGFEVDGGKWGNLSVVLKRLLCSNECAALAGGMAIDVPTGSDVDVDIIPSADSFTLHNDAVHLMPYLGFMSLPNDRVFCQGFVQLDVPLNGNRIDSSPAIGSGVLDEQVLLFLDIAAGYWLIHDECSDCLTGLAPIVELHYTTTLEDTDTVALASGGDTFDFANAGNRLDVLQLTVGLHGQFANGMNLRVGAAFPLRDDDDKLFDAELQVTVNWRF
jgi:hypothetical protein